jgi:hypothetical protein
VWGTCFRCALQLLNSNSCLCASADSHPHFGHDNISRIFFLYVSRTFLFTACVKKVGGGAREGDMCFFDLKFSHKIGIVKRGSNI